MPIDPRLDDIDDCLYRVSARVLIVENNKVLMVQEYPQMWWAFPGGGIDHGEAIQAALPREVEEELGVPAEHVSSDFQIAYYDIGGVVDGIPRMNLFFKASISSDRLSKTTEIVRWQWYTEDEFMALNMITSYDKTKLAAIIFD